MILLDNAPFIQENDNGIILNILIQPRSSKNMVAGPHGDALKIKLTAPPVDGAANKMCIKYLSKWVNIPKSSIEIISGHTSRTKRVLLRCGNDSKHRERIRSLLLSISSQKTP
jgi:uncharacterized protein (TIGR00251 family)